MLNCAVVFEILVHSADCACFLKIPDVAPAKRQRLSHISETNMAIRFTKKCMERKNIIEDRIISGVPVTFSKLEPLEETTVIEGGVRVCGIAVRYRVIFGAVLR